MNRFRKHLPLGVILVLLVVLLTAQGTMWIARAAERWEEKARSQEVLRHEVATLVMQWKASRKPDGLRQGNPGAERIVSLLPWLEQEILALQLTDKMQQISPVAIPPPEEKVFREKANLQFKDLPMATVVRFLYRLESTGRIRIIRADIERAGQGMPGVHLSCEVGLL
ncbi:MAG: hypothetical protein HQL84_15920 [Magnetococcales bacterium]|nr:hypothetical protein [Magnetococcales bacterium]MBF0151509.1 hypothetical protein [Magnetococcales bacterium]MBF0631740.1 hypothetical protein [Magnetococcales bacterium]